MKKNPYEGGESVETTRAPDPASLRDSIHNGWVVGAISAGLLLVGAVIPLIGQGFREGLPTFTAGLVLALVCAGLAYGVYRKSRIAAVLLFVLFLALWLGSLVALGNFAGVLVEVIRLLFAVMLYQAVRACFEWHQGQRHGD